MRRNKVIYIKDKDFFEKVYNSYKDMSSLTLANLIRHLNALYDMKQGEIDYKEYVEKHCKRTLVFFVEDKGNGISY